MMKLFVSVVVFLAVLLTSACSQNKPKKDPANPHNTVGKAVPAEQNRGYGGVSIESKQAAAQIGSSHVTEVEFQKTTGVLEKAELKKIEQTLADAERKSPIDHVSIAVWSDSEVAKNKEQASQPKENRKAAKAVLIVTAKNK